MPETNARGLDHLVFGVADRIMVLNFGQTLAIGSPKEIAADPAVQAAYLGDAA